MALDEASVSAEAEANGRGDGAAATAAKRTSAGAVRRALAKKLEREERLRELEGDDSRIPPLESLAVAAVASWIDTEAEIYQLIERRSLFYY